MLNNAGTYIKVFVVFRDNLVTESKLNDYRSAVPVNQRVISELR
jgi:hypothetical protein